MVPYETVTISPDKIQRTIGKISGEDSNKSIIFFGGIHGNEPAGIIALQRVLSFIEENKIPFSGKFWALQGNLPALKINKRFLDEDLNRIWYTKYNDAKGPSDDVVEFQEKEELTRHIQDFLNQSDGDVFFLNQKAPK